MVLCVLSAWVIVASLSRWVSWMSQAKHWDGKVPDFRSLVCSRNSQSDWLSQRYDV
jgi:hypothetical protein